MSAAFAAASPLDESVRVLGASEAPLAVVRGRYRFRLLIKSPRNFDLCFLTCERWFAANEAPETAPSPIRAALARARAQALEGEGCAKGLASRGG